MDNLVKSALPLSFEEWDQLPVRLKDIRNCSRLTQLKHTSCAIAAIAKTKLSWAI